MNVEDLDTVLVGKKPLSLVLHSSGVAVGYILFTPEFVLLVRIDGTEIIKTTEERIEFWLQKLSVDMARPVEIWG